jgi:hypothetical protein
MDWNEIQNFSSNIVLLPAMITYWVNLSLFSDSFLVSKIGMI